MTDNPDVERGQRVQSARQALERAENAVTRQDWDVAEADAEAAVSLIRGCKTSTDNDE